MIAKFLAVNVLVVLLLELASCHGTDRKRTGLPASEVPLTGVVESIFKAEPQEPRITSGEVQKPFEIILVKENQAEIRIVGVNSRNGRLDVVAEEILPGEKWKLLVTENPDPKDLQDYLNDVIEVHVRIGERLVTQTISLALRRKDRIEISPRIIYFRHSDLQGLRKNGIPVTKSINVMANRDPPYRFSIKEAKFNYSNSPFRVEIVPVQEGREYRLVVHIDKLPDLSKNPNQKSLKANLTVLTDDPKLLEISIRVVAFF
jgi:hypothetical protein